MTRFEPKPGDIIEITGQEYQFSPHPVISTMAYGQAARKSIVYQLKRKANNELFALKAFKPKYQENLIVSNTKDLSKYKSISGLKVCNRQCITKNSDRNLVNKYPELEYAVLMPWISGSTWTDIVVSKTIFDINSSLNYAYLLASVLVEFEDRGMAHCDIADGNVVFDLTTGSEIQLVDVEDIFAPGLPTPSYIPSGSPGYAHRTCSDGQWHAEGDRFAAAVLFAEIICWHNPQIRSKAQQEHYFDSKEMQDLESSRYELILSVLNSVNLNLSLLLKQAWESNSLCDCPRIFLWHKGIKETITPTPVVEWIPISPPPPALPVTFSGPITWNIPEIEWEQLEISTNPTINSQFGSLSDGDNILFENNVKMELPNAPILALSQEMNSSDDLLYRVFWIGSQTDDFYEVEESSDEGFTSTGKIIKTTERYFVITCKSSKSKNFRVRAGNAVGVGEWSNIISIPA